MTLETVDSVYTYTIPEAVARGYNVPTHKLVNNKKRSNTTGYQRKVQVGRNRIETEVDIIDNESNIRTSLDPMLEYPVEINVTFDENVPMRNTSTLRMVLDDYSIDSDIQSVTDGSLRIRIKLVEVIGV